MDSRVKVVAAETKIPQRLGLIRIREEALLERPGINLAVQSSSRYYFLHSVFWAVLDMGGGGQMNMLIE
jgi:hypothetical protein